MGDYSTKYRSLGYLRDFVSGDDEGSEEVEYSIHEESQENVQKNSAVDVCSQIYLRLQ